MVFVALGAEGAHAVDYTFTQIANDVTPLGARSSGSINDSQTMIFEYAPDGTAPDPFTSSGGAATLLYAGGLISDPFADDSGDAQPVNGLGRTAFKANVFGPGTGVFSGDGGPTTTIALDVATDVTSPIKSLGNNVDINDAGTVAFHATLNGSLDQHIYTGSGGALTSIVDDSGPFFSFANIAINNSGHVVFKGTLGPPAPVTANVGIFDGPDPVADKVVLEGDSFFGGTVVDVHFYRGLNDAGQIIFRAVVNIGGLFNDGIYLATPKVPRVPSMPLGLLAVLVAALLVGTWLVIKTRAAAS